MRLNESEKVKVTLKEHLGINLTVIDGTKLFLDRLKGVTEPEKKRKIIGETFVCSRPRNLVTKFRFPVALTKP